MNQQEIPLANPSATMIVVQHSEFRQPKKPFWNCRTRIGITLILFAVLSVIRLVVRLTREHNRQAQLDLQQEQMLQSLRRSYDQFNNTS